MEEKIKAIEKYMEYFPNSGNSPWSNLMICRVAQALGIEDISRMRADYGCVRINEHIKVACKYALTNSSTNFKQNGKDLLVIWNNPCGVLDFVSRDYY